ncbi:integration host factor subunit alpha [Geomesophilobacter sediminis]|uniref:Integration host factor subunit alpha n=1 Tax=Geomesophilobacter sediminis TaxID=2798584 RepID=A0A8J7S8P6_9BACT|nr:integration host factor subunit alpha [Geomesophilobacter sediminis]MBJ6727781.1 integration host factor subunit alpha [Geomesophilobacter sediminis]
MTKIEIAQRIAEQSGLNRKESLEMVEEVLGILKDTLESGEEVKISGFGSFELKDKRDRTGRNPQTGELMSIKARRVLTFRPSKLLRKALNAEEPTPPRAHREHRAHEPATAFAST